MFDGATDCSVSEVEIVYVHLVSPTGEPHEIFIGLVDLQHAHADGVFEAISEAMITYGIDDWLDKLVGAGADGAAVNVGEKQGCRIVENM